MSRARRFDDKEGLNPVRRARARSVTAKTGAAIIRRVGEPERVFPATDPMSTWRVPLAEAPSRAWRHCFLGHASALGLFFDSRLRIDEAG
jgi:hypothetical protein